MATSHSNATSIKTHVGWDMSKWFLAICDSAGSWLPGDRHCSSVCLCVSLWLHWQACSLNNGEFTPQTCISVAVQMAPASLLCFISVRTGKYIQNFVSAKSLLINEPECISVKKSELMSASIHAIDVYMRIRFRLSEPLWILLKRSSAGYIFASQTQGSVPDGSDLYLQDLPMCLVSWGIVQVPLTFKICPFCELVTTKSVYSMTEGLCLCLSESVCLWLLHYAD